MELEAVGRVAMGNLRLEVRRQVNDVDSSKRTFLHADTASNTKSLGNEGDFRFRGHLYAELACPYHGARLLAFLTTFLESLQLATTTIGRGLITFGLH